MRTRFALAAALAVLIGALCLSRSPFEAIRPRAVGGEDRTGVYPFELLRAALPTPPPLAHLRLVPGVPAPAPPPQPPRPDVASETWQQATLALPWDGPLMIRVAFCESTDNPNAVNGSSFGLFQVEGETSDNPLVQVEDAFRLWQVQGIEAWASSERCWG